MSPRPSFASDFPASAELDALVDAFEAGNYALVRAEAPKLAKATEDEAIRAAANTLVDRTNPDPLAVRMLLLTAALLLILATWWIAHGKPPPGATQTSPPIEHVH
jgi:hypothetical protein